MIFFVSGTTINTAGFKKMVRKPNPVWMRQIDEEFEVKTENGSLRGDPGDSVAFDPMSGHVWPVKAEYVKMHYAEAGAASKPPKVAKVVVKRRAAKAKPKSKKR